VETFSQKKRLGKNSYYRGGEERRRGGMGTLMELKAREARPLNKVSSVTSEGREEKTSSEGG